MAERKADAHQRKIDKLNQKIAVFNAKYKRIMKNFNDYFSLHASDNIGSDVNLLKKMQSQLDKYYSIYEYIENNVEEASIGDLSKLSTAARNAMVFFAKLKLQSYEYNSQLKTLTIDGIEYDFT